MKKHVIVVGTGPGWEKELAEAVEKYPVADVMAVNAAIAKSPVPITHAVSMHPGELGYWIYESNQNPFAHSIVESMVNLPTGELLTSIKEWNFEHPWMEMSSGVFAIKVAKELGYNKIILTGLPITGREFDRVVFRQLLDKIKDEFNNIEVPEHYWWSEFIK